MNGSAAKLINKSSTGLSPRARRALKRLWQRTPANKRAELGRKILQAAKARAAELAAKKVEDYK